MDSKIDEIISYYVDRDPMHWFVPPEGMDDEIRSKFGSYVQKARNSELESWAETPKGALALVILLDQFPRNMFRDSHESYSSDDKAYSIAIRSIAQKFDCELGKASPYQRYFFYLPLMHAEDLCSQIACRALLENLAASCEPDSAEKAFISDGVAFAQKHLDCIKQVGKFPKRNEALGRPTTEEDRVFLEKHPAGF